mmetsp:Transcript_33073/g.53639  ORF Transcript_33073/g.53639 Transcript_33073/m.53639 type:complete len:194 (+) Transcript_33073:188-769(+)|eukprot:CAMPEP_0184672146 /NCGR_PEP_ID=MMETSP0308-20130426/85924_1 /TAXON_ID=38269 /ORGANISM="Gloeochaete witrockiana, Strain SAG 46.84" /LENGTH=193 /DNA_ID=CAMNT_0027119411 /DNA_START=164 /DNA_END=745 /DNA_ORIENTATION=+
MACFYFVSAPRIAKNDVGSARSEDLCLRERSRHSSSSLLFSLHTKHSFETSSFTNATRVFYAAPSAVVLKPDPKIGKAGVKVLEQEQINTPSRDPTTNPREGGSKPDVFEEAEYRGLWKLLLHNDNANPVDYVVRCLLKVIPTISHQEAVNIMMEAHSQGVAVVTICEKELAEFYCEYLKSLKLWSSIEPADI